MVKFSLCLLICVLLAACAPRQVYTEQEVYKERCLNGVVYYSTGHGVSPAFKPNGTLFTCESERSKNE